ncbi:hypothetical protein OK015_05990 [Mycobacterium sp. Aquia_216]|uniref:hypothetical protein n=1 Tax=Mycobacterium sp. Aquia_216 TaxID=2991729 RepID=UPI00227BA66B|nr:hypothetical protein OK015_05990 [Mycobacterium sp. Aquia_216]
MADRKTSDGAVPVSPDNVVRAETGLCFGNAVREAGFDKFLHIRELVPRDMDISGGATGFVIALL